MSSSVVPAFTEPPYWMRIDEPVAASKRAVTAERIAAGEITASESIGAAVERMRAVNGHINAVVDDLGDAALEAAQALASTTFAAKRD